MKISYAPLWKLLIDKEMKKTDLISNVGIAPNTLAKLSKNKFVKLETLVKIATYFNVQITDIVIIKYEARW